MRGPAQFQAAADSLANSQLYATDTSGQVSTDEEDDGALADIVLTEAGGTMAGLVVGRLMNPVAGAATGSGGGGGGGTVEPKRRELLARTEIDEDTYVSVDFSQTPSEGSTIVFEGYLNATATNPRGVVVLPADTFLKLAHLAAVPTNSADGIALYFRETDDTGTTNNTDELYIWRGAGDAVYLRDRNSDVFIEVYEQYLEVTAGPLPAGGLFDVSGDDLEDVVAADKGSVWLDAYKHDLSFAIRRFRATTEATGTGTDIADIDFTQNDRPRPTASGEVWFKPANDNVYISGTGNIWFSTQWRFNSVGTALSLPYTGFTSVSYIGQFDTADDAANSIRAADYDATTQYIFYDRDDARIKYLSAYVAPGTQVEYWDVAHVLTDENRIVPHPVAAEFTATLVALTCPMDTAIEIPATGWIELYGSVVGDVDSFSIQIAGGEATGSGRCRSGRSPWSQAQRACGSHVGT